MALSTHLYNPTNEPAVDWLIKHAQMAYEADSWAAFAARMRAEKIDGASQAYTKYGWLAGYWETLKHHGFLTHQPLLVPSAHKLADLFDAVRLVQVTVNRTARQMTREEADWSYLGEDLRKINPDGFGCLLAGAYGGTRDWSPEWLAKGEKIRRHMGGERWVLRVQAKMPVLQNVWRNSIAVPSNPSPSTCAFELVERDDGRLVLGSGSQFSTRWVALLDNDREDTLFRMLPKEQQDMVINEREKELEAWSDGKE